MEPSTQITKVPDQSISKFVAVTGKSISQPKRVPLPLECSKKQLPGAAAAKNDKSMRPQRTSSYSNEDGDSISDGGFITASDGHSPPAPHNEPQQPAGPRGGAATAGEKAHLQLQDESPSADDEQDSRLPLKATSSEPTASQQHQEASHEEGMAGLEDLEDSVELGGSDEKQPVKRPAAARRQAHAVESDNEEQQEPSEVVVISSEDGKSEEQTGDAAGDVSGDTSSLPESSSSYNGGDEEESDDGSDASGSDEGDGSEESEGIAPRRHARSTRATTAAASTKPPAARQPALRVTRGASAAAATAPAPKQQQQASFTAKRSRVYQGSSNSSEVEDSGSEDEVEVSEDSRPAAQPRRPAPAARPKPQTRAAPQPVRARRAAAATAQQRMRSNKDSPDASNDTGSDDQGSSESESEGRARRKGGRKAAPTRAAPTRVLTRPQRAAAGRGRRVVDSDSEHGSSSEEESSSADEGSGSESGEVEDVSHSRDVEGSTDGSGEGGSKGSHDDEDESEDLVGVDLPLKHHSGPDAARQLRGRQPATDSGKDTLTAQPPAGAKAPRPPPASQVEKILQHDREKDLFLVKYKNVSYRKAGWLSRDKLEAAKSQLLRNFITRGEKIEIDEDWTDVERVVACHEAGRKGQPRREYLIKWRGLEYIDATWEREEELQEDDWEHVARYEKSCKPALTGDPKRSALRKFATDESDPMPPFGSGRQLRSYQQTAVRWMINNYVAGKCCILGDEMGLGKTAQSISTLEVLRRVGGIPGPFLLVAPLTTLGHWQREIQTWTDMNVVLYAGSAADRAIIEQYEFRHDPKDTKGRRVKEYRFDALLISYETMLKEQNKLRRIRFSAAVFDEAHKLKGAGSSTRAAAMSLDVTWKLLLTGTPIQNNLTELWGILNLLEPSKYPDLDGFMEEYAGPNGAPPSVEQVGKIRDLLAPILLRRMKEDVETLPEKEEVVVWVELTQEQREQYKALYGKEVGTLLSGAVKTNLPGMRNLAMELRKLCCHPFLCDGVEEEVRVKHALRAEPGALATEIDLLVRSCGKMVLLNKLLPKLRKEGKRVLIFSQFTRMLDVLEDYLGAKQYPFERIDGNTKGKDRQAKIDRFTNGSDEECFVFLLSTRAGGQGITLTAADTAILYDSDWNPQNDLQAMARCHRIGQDKEVTVYRLVTKNSYEEHLFGVASKKYGLDEAILGGVSNEGGDPEQDAERLATLLAHGAHALLAPKDGEEEDAVNKAAAAFQAEDIDEILKGRTEKRQLGSRAGNTFSVARFEVTEEDALMGAQGREFWAQLMPEAVAKHDEEVERRKRPQIIEEKRRRKQVNYGLDNFGGGGDESQGQGKKGKKGVKRGPSAGESADSEEELLAELARERGSDDEDHVVVLDAERGAKGGARKKRKSEGAAAAAEADGIKRWSQKACRALEDGLMGHGTFGKWLTIQQHSEHLASYTIEEVDEAGTALAKLIMEAAEVMPKVVEEHAPPKQEKPAGPSNGTAPTVRLQEDKAAKKEREEALDAAREEAMRATDALAKMPPSIKDFFCRPNELRRIAKLAVSKAKDLKEVSKLSRLIQDAERQEHKLRDKRAAGAAVDGSGAPPVPSPAGTDKAAVAAGEGPKAGPLTPGKPSAAAAAPPGTPGVGGSTTPAAALHSRAEASAQLLVKAMAHGKKGTPAAFKLPSSKAGSKEGPSLPGSPDGVVVVEEGADGVADWQEVLRPVTPELPLDGDLPPWWNRWCDEALVRAALRAGITHSHQLKPAVRKLLQQEPMFQAMLREDEGLEARLMEGAVIAKSAPSDGKEGAEGSEAGAPQVEYYFARTGHRVHVPEYLTPGRRPAKKEIRLDGPLVGPVSVLGRHGQVMNGLEVEAVLDAAVSWIHKPDASGKDEWGYVAHREYLVKLRGYYANMHAWLPYDSARQLMNWSFVERSSVHEETRNDQDADRKEYLRLQKAREEAGDPPPPVVQLREWDAEAAAARAQQLVEELSQPPYRYASSTFNPLLDMVTKRLKALVSCTVSGGQPQGTAAGKGKAGRPPKSKLPVTGGPRLPSGPTPPASPGSRAASVPDPHKKPVAGTKRAAEQQEPGGSMASGVEGKRKTQPGISAAGAPGVNSLAELGKKKKAKTTSGSAAPSLGPRLPSSAPPAAAGTSNKGPTPSATAGAGASRDVGDDSGDGEGGAAPAAAGAKSKAPQGGFEARGDPAKRPRLPGSTGSTPAKPGSQPPLAQPKAVASGSGNAGDNTKGSQGTKAGASGKGGQQSSMLGFLKPKALAGNASTKDTQPQRSMIPQGKPAASSQAKAGSAAAPEGGAEAAATLPSGPTAAVPGSGAKPKLSLQRGLQATVSPAPPGGLTGSSSRANTAANGNGKSEPAPAPAGGKQQSSSQRLPASSSAAAGSNNGAGKAGASSKATSSKAATTGGSKRQQQGGDKKAQATGAASSPAKAAGKKAGGGGSSKVGSPGEPIEISDSDE